MAGCLSRRLERGIRREAKGARGYRQVCLFLILGLDLILTAFFSSPIMQRLYGSAGGAPGGFPGAAGGPGGFPGGGAPGGFPGASEDGPSVEEVD
jgi:hypothetical protein